MFWNKKHEEAQVQGKNAINSDEYERLAKRLSDISAELGVCKASCKMLETDMANLRGNFNRKLSGLKKEEEEKKEEPTENIINGGYVAFG